MVKLKGATFLMGISYSLFKRFMPEFQAFKQVYRKSGISMMYELYLSLMFLVSILVFVSSFVVAALLHSILFSLTPFQFILAVLVSSWTTSLVALILFILYPLYRRRQRAKKIDANLVYTAGYMGVLSAGGLSIERILERVTEVEQRPSIRDLSVRAIRNIKMFGLDVASSLKDVAVHSSSEIFSKLLIGVINTIKTSGDLKGLLMFEFKSLLQVKRDQLKRTLGTLTYIGEIYITAMIVSPIVIIIMLTILSILGGSAFGLSPVTQLNLLVFMGIPLIAAVFIIILDAVLPEEE